eukprot:6004432-Prymnesium_polylepis.1
MVLAQTLLAASAAALTGRARPSAPRLAAPRLCASDSRPRFGLFRRKIPGRDQHDRQIRRQRRV